MKKQGKKIFIGVLITLIVGGLIIVITLNNHSESNTTNEMNLASNYLQENTLKNNENAEIETETNEISVENLKEENKTENQKENLLKEQESIIINEEKSNNNNVDDLDKVPIINKTQEQENNIEPQKNSNNNQNSEQIKLPSENKTPNISQEENKETNVKQEEKHEETQKEVIDPQIPKEPKNEEEPKEEIKEEPKTENVHTYKYNSTITEQIKQDILNNESDYMKQYGYTIVIDESIVTLTNQFTYTNTRVKDKIIKKFGTIRIYARDYYYNGEYMFTECYII